MKIDLSFDTSVTSSKFAAGIEATAEGVAKFYDTQFNNPITITIDVGFGEVDGQAIPANGGAESISNYAGAYTYAQVRAAFAADATTADDKTALASLPLTDPTPGGSGSFSATTAEAKALGLSLTNALPGPDGFTGLDSSSTWVFNTTNTNGSDVPIGDLDAFSFMAHEFSEILGRQMNFGAFSGDIGGGYYPYDLFDYTGAGVRSFSASKADRFFSLDGGDTNTSQHYFNSHPGDGDPFDWLPNGTKGSYLPSGGPDSYDFEGSVGAVSASDLRLMDILGYDPTPSLTASGLANSGAKFSLQIHDVSQGAATASTTGLYLSTTSKISTADTLLAQIATPAIAAGGTASESVALALSSSLAPGTYYVGAIADYNGAVTEPETANGVSNAVPILVVANSNIATISGKAGVDAFAPGTLTLASALTLDGSLTVTGAFTDTAAIGGTGTLALAGGTTAIDTGASLAVSHMSVSGTAAATVGVANLVYGGTWSQSAGSVSVDAGDRLNFSGAGDTFTGTLAGAGTVAFIAGSDAITGATLAGASTLIGSSATVTLGGAIDLVHQITAATANLLVSTAGVTLSGGGVVELTDSASNEIHGVNPLVALTNNDRIEGAGRIGAGDMRLINGAAGTIIGDDSLALILDTGGYAIANAGAIYALGAGGTLIESALVNAGTLNAVAATLTVDGAVAGAGMVRINGGAAVFASTFSQNVAFTGTTGALKLAHSQGYGGTITGFSKTGTTSLDLEDIGFGAATKAVYAGTTTSGVLTVSDGAEIAKIRLEGDYLASTFTVASDGHSGTIVKDPVGGAGASAGFVAAMSSFAAPLVAISAPTLSPLAQARMLMAAPKFAQHA